jgi:hypothetical protein
MTGPSVVSGTGRFDAILGVALDIRVSIRPNTVRISVGFLERAVLKNPSQGGLCPKDATRINPNIANGSPEFSSALRSAAGEILGFHQTTENDGA